MEAVDGFRLELGEGAGYDPASDVAWWFDIERSELFTRIVDGGNTVRHRLPVAGSALAVTSDRRQLLVAENGLYFRDPANGALDLHLPLEADNPITRSNDARVHPSGAFWVSTMGWKCQPGVGSFYRYFRGTLTRLWGGVTIPNAICFSPDGTVAYFCDTPTRTVMRVATDPEDGSPVGDPEVFLSGLAGGPDGAVTDAEGNMWLTLFGAGTVVGHSPRGEKLGEITVPAANVTCPAFVGRDARSMLITTALYGLSADERATRPEAGVTFTTRLSFQGRFDPPVRL